MNNWIELFISIISILKWKKKIVDAFFFYKKKCFFKYFQSNSLKLKFWNETIIVFKKHENSNDLILISKLKMLWNNNFGTKKRKKFVFFSRVFFFFRFLNWFKAFEILKHFNCFFYYQQQQMADSNTGGPAGRGSRGRGFGRGRGRGGGRGRGRGGRQGGGRKVTFEILVWIDCVLLCCRYLQLLFSCFGWWSFFFREFMLKKFDVFFFFKKFFSFSLSLSNIISKTIYTNICFMTIVGRRWWYWKLGSSHQTRTLG